MDRVDLENWFARHPGSSSAEQSGAQVAWASTLLDECQEQARQHAHYDAWIHARDIAEDSLHRFERAFGLPASDVFVTREVCREVARELRRSEPQPDDIDEREWLSRPLLESLDLEAQRMLHEWVVELAAKEEHEAWKEILYVTDRLARQFIHESGMTNELAWDFDRSYPKIAARVARMMIREFERHAVGSCRPVPLRR